MNAFEVLGLSQNADQSQVRAAYRSSVKRCHPDQFLDPAQQERAQEQLIRLNLAYEEALRITTQRRVGYNTVSLEDAKQLCRRLIQQQRYESALRQLMRSDSKDSEWFFLQGEVLMGMRQYANAHDSFREAVRREPDNLQYRRGAFEAAKAVKKHNQPVQRAVDALGNLFHHR